MAGYAYRINGEFLDLHAEQEVSFSVESALLSDSILPGILSMPSSLPLTSRNKRLLGNLNLLDFWDYEGKYNCELWLEGNYFRSGFITINGSDDKDADITFSEFDAEKQFDNKSLQDLEYPVYDIAINREDNEAPLPDFYPEILARLENDYDGEKDWVTPTIYNINAEGILDKLIDGESSEPADRGRHQNLIYLGTVSSNTGGYTINFDLNGYYFIFNPTSVVNLRYSEKNSFSAFLYLEFVMKKVFDSLGLKIDYNKLSFSEYKNLIIYTNRAICFWANIDFLTQYSNERFYEDKIDIKQFVPDVSIKDFLLNIKNLFCLVYVPDYLSDTVSIKCKSDIIAEMQEIDISDKAQPFDKWEKSSYEIYKAITYGRFVERPDIPETKDLQFIGNYANTAALPADATDKQYCYLTDEDKLMQYNAGTALWTELAKNGINGTVNAYFEKNATKKLDTNVDTPKNASFMPREIELYGEDAVNEPEFQKGRFRLYVPTLPYSLTTDASIVDNGPNDNGKMSNLFLMFYRGLQDSVFLDDFYGPQTWQYPFASIDAKPAFWDGTAPDEYDATLEMFGEKGIYERFHKKWMTMFTKTRTVYATINIHAHEISMILNSKLRIQNASFITKKITFKASPSQIKPCKAEMYQIMQ